MWHLLLLVAGAQAYFNESCNALHLAEVCEDECNTDLNICIAGAGGNYDKIHECLRIHENCFQSCPCHAVCPWGCPCTANGKVWECENTCTDLYHDEAVLVMKFLIDQKKNLFQCTKLCNEKACECVNDCPIFDYACSEKCGLGSG